MSPPAAKPDSPWKWLKPNQDQEKFVTWCDAECAIARMAKSTRIATSMPDMIHCALAVTRTPRMTISTITRNQAEPTSVISAVLFDADALNSPSVTCPAGSDPATMKIVAEMTSDQPAMKPRPGCRILATQA